jgi:hypothetical protein
LIWPLSGPPQPDQKALSMRAKTRPATSLVLFMSAALASGCVERRFVITTEPPGAIVFDEKGLPMGAAPTDRTFTYYGEYEFTLVKDGYETQVVREKVRAPFYEWFILDFFSENVIPWTLRDVRRFNYRLQPKQSVPAETVLDRADGLRERGKTIGVPLPNQPPAPGPIAPTLMPPVP